MKDPQLEALLLELSAGGPGTLEDRARRLGADRRLIVYGSLGPGGTNHHVLAGVPGRWSPGWITGELVEAGWGAALGYPALLWKAEGPRVPAHLFESERLVSHWARLDAFEGEAYERLLVPFLREGQAPVAGQVYACRRKP